MNETIHLHTSSTNLAIVLTNDGHLPLLAW